LKNYKSQIDKLNLKKSKNVKWIYKSSKILF
jgi:hypothetical protein